MATGIKKICYFEEYGEKNTPVVLNAVAQHPEERDQGIIVEGL